MTTALSLYLDALRFTAAVFVFVGHYSAQRHSGGLFWQAFSHGRTAVLVFFVLSGFVIAWITETKERTLEEYALSRAARLYSVILPVFLIMAALDALGSAIDPRLYELEWRLSTVHPLVGYALSVVFLGQSWTLDVAPRSDLPFWSLNCEALVLRPLRCGDISTGTAANGGDYSGSAVGWAQGPSPLPGLADGRRGVAMAERAAADLGNSFDVRRRRGASRVRVA